MKRCCKCGSHKPIEEFYRNASKQDGRGTECKVCANACVKDWQHRHKAKLNEWQMRYYRNNREKKLAHSRANHAVKIGVLEKQPCSQCNAPTADKHHHDYSRPLDIVWLCRKCHKAEHAKEAAVA